MTTIRFASYNLLDYGLSDTAEATARYERVHEVIRNLGADVVAVQEVIADDPDDEGGPDKAALAGKKLAQLAEATGLEYEHAPGKPALAVGNHRFHVGLLWKPGIEPAGGFRTYSGTNVWHSLVTLDLDVGAARPLRHGAFHATPFGRYRRADEFERVLSTMTRPDNRPPGLIGGDWNSVSADRVFKPGCVSEDDAEPDRWVYYDPDPYTGLDADRQPRQWHGDLVYQTKWEYNDVGERRWWADREPGEVLYAGGLRDVAAALNAPWKTTVGHWPTGDPFGARRIDAVRVTHEVVDALRDYAVVDSELALTASDHLPVLVDYDPAAIPAQEA
ncbi:endonuclease/exonuclease/phosphatase family protein [Saccharopolyspora taberi]|uniref:Endonuclease/exonuclease/phosphatase domain-containing protein n=1 Tax=Saccharopolyspora taberi TaxID=60895 RepID=A0ABN3V8P0_9PSEU